MLILVEKEQSEAEGKLGESSVQSVSRRMSDHQSQKLLRSPVK